MYDPAFERQCRRVFGDRLAKRFLLYLSKHDEGTDILASDLAELIRQTFIRLTWRTVPDRIREADRFVLQALILELMIRLVAYYDNPPQAIRRKRPVDRTQADLDLDRAA